MLKKIITVSGAVALLCAGAFAIPDDTKMKHITSADFVGSYGTRILSPDTAYFLNGNVIVPANWTLRVMAGTRVYGTYSTSDVTKTSMLIIAPKGRLQSLGTIDAPVVFTSLRDEGKDSCDLGPGAKGLWGGIIWCGEAPISRPSIHYPEGLPTGLPGIYYGGTDAAYNGGIMRFTSIRHGGCAVASNSETNGLSLYALGTGTEVNNVEVYANSDDGFEFFGGTVNTKNLISVFNNDDMFDIDEGFVGKNQFWFALEQEYEGDRGGEWDGKIDASNLFASRPTIMNYTFIGGGSTSSNPLIAGDAGTQGIMIRDSMGGTFLNGIITEFGSQAVKRGKQSDGYNVLGKPFGNSGDSVRMQGNIFYNCRGNNTWNNMITPTSDVPYLQANLNDTLDPMLGNVTRVCCEKLDPRPAPCSPAFFNYVSKPDSWFSTANYRGAFDTSSTFWCRWAKIAEHFVTPVTVGFYNEIPQNEWGVMFLNINMWKSGGSNIGWNDLTSSIKVNGIETVNPTDPAYVAGYNWIQKKTSRYADGSCRTGTHYIMYLSPNFYTKLNINKVGTYKVTYDLNLDNGTNAKGSYSFKVKGMGN